MNTAKPLEEVIREMTAKVFIDTARHNIGQREKGVNAGPFVARMLKAVGLSPGYAWCAAFVRAMLNDAGLPNRGLQGRKAAAVIEWAKWAKAQNRIIPADKVEPGDLFFWLNPNGTGHTGIVEHIEFDTKLKRWVINTIEGNTNQAGSREGDGVYAREHIVTERIKFIRVL